MSATQTLESTTALAQAGDRTPDRITTADQFSAALQRWTGRFNVLTPFTTFSGLAASHGLVVSQVKISADASKNGPGEVYDGLPFLGKDEVALAKIALRKLAECAGISTQTFRTDPRTIPHYWEFKAVASYRGIDGVTISREATMEWDLRDGSARLKGWTPQQVQEGRKHGSRNCEARAINAAIREAGCGLKQKYTRAELEKPFVVLRVAFTPDMSDPAVKQIVTTQALSSTAMLYPARPSQAIADVVEPDTPSAAEPRLVGSSAAPAAASTSAAPAQASTPAPDPDRPPSPDAVRIVKVDPKTGTNQKTGRPWTRYSIVDSNGADHSTFDKGLADAAEAFRQSGAWVDITVEQDGQYKNLVEIQPAGRQPSLGFDPEQL